MCSLTAISTDFKQKIENVKGKQVLTDKKIQDLELKYTSTSQDVETIQNQLS